MCRYETYWGQQGWDNTNSGITFKITNNPGVIKVGNIVMVTDVDHVSPRAYVHRDKIHNYLLHDGTDSTVIYRFY